MFGNRTRGKQARSSTSRGKSRRMLVGPVERLESRLLLASRPPTVPETQYSQASEYPALMELMAKNVAYLTWAIGDKVEGYTVNTVIDQTGTSGFYGIGLTKTSKDSLFLFRGTSSFADALSDVNPNGIGYNQFVSAKSAVESWFAGQGATPIDLGGHSLGGALVQWFAADWTSQGKTLGNVYAFNSPGIGSTEAAKFVPANAGSVMFHIQDGDVVSMAGQAFIQGEYTEYHFNDYNLIHKHTYGMLSDATAEGDYPMAPGETASAPQPTSLLSSANFTYDDPNFITDMTVISTEASVLGFSSLANYANNVFHRGTAEQARENLGSDLQSGLSELTSFFSNFVAVTNHGTIQKINFRVSTTFTLYGATIAPNDLTFVYDANQSQYEMYGSLTVSTSGQSITANLGTAAKPGLVIQNGSILGVNMSVTANLTLFGVTIQPNNLTFVYDAKASEYEIYGSLTVTTSGQLITATLGTAAQPGLDIKNGTITGVNMSITANLSLFGLTLAPTNLTFVYDAANSRYEIYGALTVMVSGQTITANLGTQALPGLVIKSGTITNVNMGVSSDLNIGGVQIHAVNLGVIYSLANHSYGLYGAITVTNVFSASASFGTPQAPGITITNGKFVVSNLQLSLSDVKLGAFTLKNLSVSYTTDSQSNVTFQASATVAMPDGINVGGSIKFINGQIDSIALLVTGAKIPIGDTGVYIDSLGASVTGLSSGPSFDQLQVSGYASFYFGPSLSIGGNTAQLLRVDGSITINKTSLNVTVGVYVGAISTGTTKKVGYGLDVPNYNGLVASGTGTLNINWSTGVASVTANVSLLDGAVTLSGGIVLDGPTSSIGIRASASVQIPGGVPVIGGLSLGSGNFALVYNGSTKTGYAAAWGAYTITIGGGTHYLWDHHGKWTDPSISTSFSGGVKFTIGSNSLSFIHGDDLTNLDNTTKVILNGHIPGVNLRANLAAQTPALSLPFPDSQANGSATDTNNTFTLTSGSNQSGSVYTTTTHPFANGFDSTFQFSLSPNSEGLAFVVQAVGADALGGPGPQLGFDGGIGMGLAVKFGTHQNSSTDDPSGNFVSINVSGSDAMNALATTRALGVNLADGNAHTAEIRYTPSGDDNGWGEVDLFLDGSKQPVVSATDSLENLLGMDSGGDGENAYFGFASGTSLTTTGAAVVSDFSLLTDTTPPASTENAYPEFADATNLTYAGAAALDGSNVALDPKIGANTAGAIWTQTPLNVTGGFQETFQVQTTPGGTGGFALVFQNDPAGNSAVGSAGNGLGMGGLQNAVAIAFSDGANSPEPALGNQSVGVYTPVGGVVQADALHLAGTTSQLPVTLNDGAAHTIIVVYNPTDGNELSVYMEGSVAPVLTVTGINLASLVGSSTATIGFTGASAASAQSTELVDWFHVTGVTPPPSPPPAPGPGVVIGPNASVPTRSIAPPSVVVPSGTPYIPPAAAGSSGAAAPPQSNVAEPPAVAPPQDSEADRNPSPPAATFVTSTTTATSSPTAPRVNGSKTHTVHARLPHPVPKHPGGPRYLGQHLSRPAHPALSTHHVK